MATTDPSPSPRSLKSLFYWSNLFAACFMLMLAITVGCWRYTCFALHVSLVGYLVLILFLFYANEVDFRHTVAENNEKIADLEEQVETHLDTIEAMREEAESKDPAESD
ncbi:hypothetical protein [Nocardia blacklockiae]|uniref:hypothetical protein n=1 Tax=Nocardia blacklockiae TaxID=480036 RepID=UPI001894832D|nr:hypothetical protein [Nocardia blacklockiae]MBF6171295.1 hypothetical protein [Nocardia blacklockiae]